MGKTQNKQLNYEEIISLLHVYESEFEYRDKTLYSRMYSLFYVSLIIMICPFISIGEIKLNLHNLHPNFFIIMGMFCESLSFFISIIHADRLKKSSITYNRIINMLPIEYRRIPTINQQNKKPIQRLKEKFMNISLTYIIPTLFFVLSICAGIVLLVTQTQ